MKDFFISYNRADRHWAEWIAWQLEENGFTVILQAWDFRPGGNFVVDMQKATQDATRTMPCCHWIIWPRFTQPEWAAAFARDFTACSL